MSAFEGDAKQLNYEELHSEMNALAAEWRGRPYLSNDWSHGVLYGELREQLRNKHGEDCFIGGSRTDSVDYRVSCVSIPKV